MKKFFDYFDVDGDHIILLTLLIVWLTFIASLIFKYPLYSFITIAIYTAYIIHHVNKHSDDQGLYGYRIQQLQSVINDLHMV